MSTPRSRRDPDCTFAESASAAAEALIEQPVAAESTGQPAALIASLRHAAKSGGRRELETARGRRAIQSKSDGMSPHTCGRSVTASVARALAGRDAGYRSGCELNSDIAPRLAVPTLVPLSQES